MTSNPLSANPAALPPALHPALGEHLLSLARHVRQCQAAQQRWVGTARLAERAHGLLAPRFMTTVVVGAALLLALCTGWS